jgi:hypothetical protein
LILYRFLIATLIEIWVAVLLACDFLLIVLVNILTVILKLVSEINRSWHIKTHRMAFLKALIILS